MKRKDCRKEFDAVYSYSIFDFLVVFFAYFLLLISFSLFIILIHLPFMLAGILNIWFTLCVVFFSAPLLAFYVFYCIDPAKYKSFFFKTIEKKVHIKEVLN